MYKAQAGELLKLLLAAITYPQLFKLSIPQQGLGLKRRYETCHHYWVEHLQNNKDFQNQAIKYFAEQQNNDQINSLLLLGAGRLYDVDVSLLKKHIKKIILQDADPLCLSYWIKAFNHHSSQNIYNIKDLTSCFYPWYQKIKQLNKADLLTEFQAFGKNVSSHSTTALPQVDIIFSQNILSQLPLYFIEATKAAIKKSRIKKSINPEYYDKLYLLAQEFFIYQHLQSLNESKAKMILLIADISCCEYSIENSDKFDIVTAPPVEYQNQRWVASNNSAEKLLSASYTNLLEPALDLNKIELIMNNYKSIFKNNWVWHISPQGLEQKSKGFAHALQALCLWKIN